MERLADEPPLSNTERLVLVAQEAHENLHVTEASVRAISNVAADYLLRAISIIEAIIQNPGTVSMVFGAKALDCIYEAEYFVADENEALKSVRKNVQDVTVRLCWRGTDPNDDEGMIRAFQRAFMRDVQEDDQQMVSRLMNANRHLAGERPGQKSRRRAAPRPERTLQRSVSVPGARTPGPQHRRATTAEGTRTPAPAGAEGQPFVPRQPPAAARAPDAARAVDAVFVRWAWIRMCLNILARPNHIQTIAAWIRMNP